MAAVVVLLVGLVVAEERPSFLLVVLEVVVELLVVLEVVEEYQS